MILAVNIRDGDVRMGVIEEMRRRINKIRWERWRAKQNKELEKSYFYAWGESWSDVPPEKCGCDECPKVVALKGAEEDFNYRMYEYTIITESLVIDEDGTRNIYITCHLGTRHEVGEWIEAGCQNAVDLSEPRVFTWVSVAPEGKEFKAHEGWPIGRPKNFLLEINPDTGEYWIKEWDPDEGWVVLRYGNEMPRNELCGADMAGEYFADNYMYSNYAFDDDMKSPEEVNEASVYDTEWHSYDDIVPYQVDARGNCGEENPDLSAVKYEDITNGFRCWIECH